MNIFYLDPDPETCAALHCDKHCVKMILEYAQLLSTAHHVIDPVKFNPITGEMPPPRADIYKITHVNHPSAKWVRQSLQHYRWLRRLLEWSCDQYTQRYGKVHKVEKSGLLDRLYVPPMRLIDRGWQDPPQCMPDEYKRDCCVSAYQTYYKHDKKSFARWLNGPEPSFMS